METHKLVFTLISRLFKTKFCQKPFLWEQMNILMREKQIEWKHFLLNFCDLTDVTVVRVYNYKRKSIYKLISGGVIVGCIITIYELDALL